MTSTEFQPDSPATHIQTLREVGAHFYARGWSVGTSSNYSVVTSRDPFELLITASGKHKGRLRTDDFVRLDRDGNQSLSEQPQPSAEATLHVALTTDPQVNAVLHTHSIWATLLSDLYHEQGMLQIEGYEMLKGLRGVTTHAFPATLKIVENTQDIPHLASQLRSWRRAGDPLVEHGFLLRRHGLYTWGHDLDEAVRHVEILEFLFEVLGRRLSLVPHPTAAW